MTWRGSRTWPPGPARHPDGDPATAAACFAEGLGLWAGTALAGIPGPYAAAQRTRLSELRLTVQEEHLACAVDLGSYDQAAAELSALVDGHPLRERLRELQMHALYGADRQTDALDSFRQASRLLRDELGIDPGSGLRTMHQRILSTDPERGQRVRGLVADRPFTKGRKAGPAEADPSLPAANLGGRNQEPGTTGVM